MRFLFKNNLEKKIVLKLQKKKQFLNFKIKSLAQKNQLIKNLRLFQNLLRIVSQLQISEHKLQFKTVKKSKNNKKSQQKKNNLKNKLKNKQKNKLKYKIKMIMRLKD